MSIHILYNGSVYFIENNRPISDIVENFIEEFDDDFSADSLLVYNKSLNIFYTYDVTGTGDYGCLPQELYPAAYELMGIERRTK